MTTPKAAVISQSYSIEMAPAAIKKLADIQTAVAEAETLTMQASKMTIKDEASNTAVSAHVVKMSKVGKVLEGLRKFFTKPIADRKKFIDDKFKEWTVDFATEERRLRDQVGGWFIKQRDKAAAEQRERDRLEQEKLRKARNLGRAAPKPRVEAPVEKPAATTQTLVGSVNVRTKWVYDGVTDMAAVPEKYTKKVVDVSAVKAAIDQGICEISGLLILERPITSAR